MNLRRPGIQDRAKVPRQNIRNMTPKIRIGYREGLLFHFLQIDHPIKHIYGTSAKVTFYFTASDSFDEFLKHKNKTKKWVFTETRGLFYPLPVFGEISYE